MPQRDVARGDRRTIRVPEVRGIENGRERVGKRPVGVSARRDRGLERGVERQPALLFAHPLETPQLRARGIDAIARAFPLNQRRRLPAGPSRPRWPRGRTPRRDRSSRQSTPATPGADRCGSIPAIVLRIRAPETRRWPRGWWRASARTIRSARPRGARVRRSRARPGSRRRTSGEAEGTRSRRAATACCAAFANVPACAAPSRSSVSISAGNDANPRSAVAAAAGSAAGPSPNTR